MKIFAVVGSPRRNGNTDILVDEVLRGAKDVGATFEKIFLNDLDIRPCQSTCSDYCKKKGSCRIEDDMSALYDRLYDSDVIILGTPVYWWGPSAQMKAFIDRWYAFSHPDFVHKMKGKKVVLVAPFEDSDPSTPDALVMMIEKSTNYCKMEFFRRLLVTAGEKGIVKKNQQAMKQAYRIGIELK